MIALITPTGLRPIPFTLCTHYMRRQTYKDKVIWIIIDDGIPRSTDQVNENFKENWEVIKIYPIPLWSAGQNTQSRNIIAGINTLLSNYKKEEIEAIFIIEDDDYYRPNYLERMMINFGTYDLIGERNTIYYNVQYRKHVTNPNTIHASLFQTAFTMNILPVFMNCCPHKFIDAVFWSKGQNRNLFYENDLAVGIKGLPGRAGIGAGHSRAMNMRDDSNLIYLRSLIGEEDARNYESYYRDSRQSQHTLFAKKRL